MRIKLLSSASKDLEGGYQFYEKQSRGLGDYFLDSVFSDIDSLLIHAGVHEKHFGFYRLLSSKFPFAIYYDIQGGSVLVYAILDCRRKPTWTRQRFEN